MLELGLRRHLTHLGILNRNKVEDDEGQGKHRHGDIHHEVHVGHLGIGSHRSDERTHEHGGQRAGKRVQRTTDHIELVTAVTAATEQVEHGVNHRIQDANGETGNECAQQIHAESGDTT